ncbi:MAG: hypothetical protein EBU36_05165, partial [Verrucomicrobia bacterium]|nr:hypothetical protein [Verrucomicrobiota bacterium]
MVVALFFAIPSVYSTDALTLPGPVYVIPIQGEIQKGLVYIVRRGVKDALEAQASALVLDMNTPGGEGEAMKEIMAAVAKFEPSERTFTFVN